MGDDLLIYSSTPILDRKRKSPCTRTVLIIDEFVNGSSSEW